MNKLHMVTFLLVVIGGLNWLLLGLFNWELSMLVGGMSSITAKVIFVLIGLSAVYELVTHKKNCSCCKGMKGMKGGGDQQAMPGGGNAGM